MRLVAWLALAAVLLPGVDRARAATDFTVAPFADVVAAYRPSDIRLVDRHGEVIHETRVDERRRRLAWVSLSDVSPALVDAVLRSEDQRFFAHGGVDGWALAAAVSQWASGGPKRGASTITMQVASFVDPAARSGRRRGWREKWRQIGAAWRLEAHWSKAEILEAYLNLATFRGEIEGVGAAAHVLFGKLPHGLDAAESVVLAALLRSPNAAAPALRARVDDLWRRAYPGDESEPAAAPWESAIARVYGVAGAQGPRQAQAPHLAARLRRVDSASSVLATTLDASLQRIAVDSLHGHLLGLRERRVRDGAVLVVDNASGEVLAYVGSSGSLSEARHVDGVRARRQAGSTLKPFVYGLAIDQRILTAASLLDDSPLEIPTSNGLYRPENYDERFRGLVTLRTALAGSLNVPAVRTVDLIGVESAARTLRRLGMGSLDREGAYYGPALALGSADVTLWELVGAYRALARGGVYSPLRETSRVVAADERIFSSASSYVVSDILADRDARGVTFGWESPLATPFWAAVKTGTSKDMRDNWCIGYSDRFTVGVWVGNFSGRPMGDVSGITGAAPVWLDVMRWLHREQPSRSPEVPAGLARAPGGEWFLDGTAASTGPLPVSSRPARIVDPAAGTSFAIDPEIPVEQQRIDFRAQGANEGAQWELDGQQLSGARPDAGVRSLPWRPQPGRHELRLLDREGQVLDHVWFTVRGTQP